MSVPARHIVFSRGEQERTCGGDSESAAVFSPCTCSDRLTGGQCEVREIDRFLKIEDEHVRSVERFDEPGDDLLVLLIRAVEQRRRLPVYVPGEDADLDRGECAVLVEGGVHHPRDPVVAQAAVPEPDLVVLTDTPQPETRSL